MSDSDDERHDGTEVGYKRPPEGSRFKAGRSGNPNGRPKGTRNLATDLTALMEKRVIIQEDGETRQVSAQQAMLLKVLSRSRISCCAGCGRAARCRPTCTGR
jgi:Family of unknown function (DUF5681)